MNNRNENRDRPITVQDEMAALLPFYITGRLGLRDQMRVEQWVEDSSQGQKALENAYGDQRSAIDANEAIVSPSGTLGQLLKDIDAEPSQAWSNYVGGNMASWIMSWLNIIPSGFTWGALLSLLLLTTIQSTLLWKTVETPSWKISSEASEKLRDLIGGEKIAYIHFAPNAQLQTISSLLTSLGARIVDGPRSPNIYIIAFRKDKNLPPVQQRIHQLAKRTDLVQRITDKQKP